MKSRSYTVTDAEGYSTEFSGVDRCWFPASELEHVILYTIDGELEVLALEDPRRAAEAVRLICEEDRGNATILGVYSRRGSNV